MRIYLDTNILAFIVGRDKWASISTDVKFVIKDYETLLLTSSVCIHELVHLIQIGKVSIPGKKDICEAARSALNELEELGVTMMQVSDKHIATLINLPLYDDHRDPNDRLIIAQAISDRIPLISSDRKFTRYVRHGLDFVFNER